MILGIGIDLVEVEEIKKVIERWGERFLGRVYTEREREYCEGRGCPYLTFAGRFAAKEAFFKAMGTGWSGGMRWRDVEVLNASNGRPEVLLHGRAAQAAEDKGVKAIHVSISHDRDHAVAVVMLEG